MEALSISDFRNNLASSFKRASNKERVLIRRKNQLFALVSVGKEDLVISPQLEARIAEAEKACREGKYVSCSTTEELDNFLDNL